MIFRFLVSFHYHRKTDLKSIADSYVGSCEAFADSGAFSAYSLGAEIKLEEYAAWLKDWDQLLTVKATLDVIGDYQATMRNTRALEDRGLRVLPVFHVGTPWTQLEKLCAEYDYLALGGMVPHSTNQQGVLRWLVRCFQIAKETGTVFHGFGQTSLQTLLALPFYSVDSSSWGSGARFGTISLWDEKRRDMVKLDTGKMAEARKHAALLRAHGANPAAVGKPGFAMASRRSGEQYIRENTVMRGVPALAYLRLGEYLARRHKVPVPASIVGRVSQVDRCPRVYLADPAESHLVAATGHMGTVVFLADGADSQLKAAARGISPVTRGGRYTSRKPTRLTSKPPPTT